MKSRPDPEKTSFSKEFRRVVNSKRVQQAIAALEADPSLEPQDLGELQMAVVLAEVERRRFGVTSPSLYDAAWEATVPVLASPQWESGHRDLCNEILAQPEMQRLWRQWTLPPGSRGPTSDLAMAKAMLFLVSTFPQLKSSRAHHHVFEEHRPLQDFFSAYDRQGHEHGAPRLAVGADAPSGLRLYGYSQTRELMKKLARPGIALAWQANIEMLKALRAIHPEVGRRLLLDGTAYPAWAKQKGHVGEVDPLREAALRARTPHAGFRAMQHTATGKFDIRPDDTARKLFRGGLPKSWRGYYWVVLVDQATGLPVMAVMQDAAINEFLATEKLLGELFNLWSDIGTQMIVADAAWDREQQISTIVRRFGIAPIVRAGAVIGGRSLTERDTRDGKLTAIDERGRVRCRHGWMDLVAVEHPSRDDLDPGVATPDAEHRLRLRCPLENADSLAARKQSCGSRVTAQMQLHWARLTEYPMHPHGRPREFAMRNVMIARLSQVESTISRYKQRGLGNPGATRPRTLEMTEQTAYMALCSASFTALTLADQRKRHGLSLTSLQPPPHQPPARPADLPVAVGDASNDARRPRLRVIKGGAA